MNASSPSPRTPGLDSPRLLYIGDIPISSTVASSALIYRLLATYPKDRLQIEQSNLMEFPAAETRPPGVPYRSFYAGRPRLLRTRFIHQYGRYLFKRTAARGRRLARRLKRDPWQPQAILTIAHGHGWLIASQTARQLDIPLHLIVHDDVFPTTFLGSEMREEFDRQFEEVYRRAASRFCVSPFMVEQYQAQYGVTGQVLYPSRASDGPEYNTPPARVALPKPSLHFAYAGSLYIRGYTQVLGQLAAILGSRGHRLTIFSGLEPQYAATYGLEHPYVTLRPMVPRAELIRFLHDEADVLFAPMSFAREDRSNMEICFLSKLTDYTAVGLPILVCGPAYGSAVKWAKESNAAEAIDRVEDLGAAVERLENPELRQRLAAGAISEGGNRFSYEKAAGEFLQELCKAQNASIG